MRCRQLTVQRWKRFAAIVLLAVSVGCQTVNTELASLFSGAPATQSASDAIPAGTDERKFQIEIRESGHQPLLAQLPLPEILYVQQALEQAGAIRRFRRMKIEIYRQLPNGGGHRLDIAFDRAKRRVPPSADYAIHPNDRIVITEEKSTVVDDMLEHLSGSLGK